MALHAAQSSVLTAAVFPEFDKLAAGPLRPLLLPGQDQFVFSMYGAPGDLVGVSNLVEVMRRDALGNGFDPGPTPGPDTKAVFAYLARQHWPVVCYSGSDMQIKGGRAVFGAAHAAALAPMDEAGAFAAVQLGEWGYYFHNLSHNEGWFRDVFGADYEQYRHLRKPAGLAGYDRRPTSRRECYEVLRDYFQSRDRDLLGRTISVTGHSHYESYAAEWGARCVGLEIGENIAFTQSKLAFARGAARQWQRPWSVQVSPWFHGACTTSGPLRQEGGGARGLEAGHSLSLYERLWLHGWFSGAAMVTPENSIAIFFEQAAAPWTLTSHGQKAVEVYGFMRTHPRGIPYAPIAVVLDHLAGYNAYMDKPWGILPVTPADRELRDLFDAQLFPGSDHIHGRPDPANPEAAYLRPTPFGECYDVLLSSVSGGLLTHYPVVLLAGDIEFTPSFLHELESALRAGSRVLFSRRHQETLGNGLARLAHLGQVEVLESWVNPATGRPAAISNERLRQLADGCLPVEVTGDPVQYSINRLPSGWVVELINNQGVAKKPKEAAVTDPRAVARVQLRPRTSVAVARAWRSGRAYPSPTVISTEVGPGGVEYVQLVESSR